jgi:hypothetical protein
MQHCLTRRIPCVMIALAAIVAVTSAQQEVAAPETFTANAKVGDQKAGSAAIVTIQIGAYTDPRDRTTMLEALRLGGYPRLLPVLRQMPDVGTVELNGRKVSIKWARQTPAEKGRTISIVTDRPLFFVGGGAVDAKPRAGFELAFLLLQVDAAGSGTGTMAAAARVKPDGSGGVQIDDYADAPITLAVRKSSK